MELMGNLVEQILECRTGDPSVPAKQHLIIVMPLELPRRQFQTADCTTFTPKGFS